MVTRAVYRQGVILLVASVIGVAVFIATHPSGVSPSSCYADSKKCACPVAPGETIVMPCSSMNNPESCGACSVLTVDGTRSGRACMTVR